MLAQNELAAEDHCAGNIKNSSIQSCKNEIKRSRYILAIDDDIITLKMISLFLSDLDIEIITAENGQTAMCLIQEYRPELILLDIMMSEISGFDVCKTIRSKFSSSELPILFITGKNLVSDFVRGFDLGGNDFIVKPINRDELIARVYCQLRQRDTNISLRNNVVDRSSEVFQITANQSIKSQHIRLSKLLHDVNDSIIAVDSNEQIIYINARCCITLMISDMSLYIGKQFIDLIEKSFKKIIVNPEYFSESSFHEIHFVTAHGDSIELRAQRSVLRIESEEFTIYSIQDSVKVHTTATISEWISGQMETTVHRKSPRSEKNHKKSIPVQVLNENSIGETERIELVQAVMSDSIKLWKKVTGLEKWHFAEMSGIWKVHPDDNGWQRTATLDKYLDIRKMPRFPRWVNIIDSALFVLSAAEKVDSPKEHTVQLKENLDKLKSSLKCERLVGRYDLK